MEKNIIPIVSVIIPTYNHANYVLDTLESVFAQTFIGYEIIVINDGSPDNTSEVLRPLVDAGRIRYIEQENQGQAAARNRGLAEAKGEFIAFLDDDDLWPPDKLEWQVLALNSRPDVSMVGGSADLIDESAQVFGEIVCPEGILAFEDLFNGSPFISPGQTLIRSQILQKVRGLDESVWGADDLDLYLKIAYESKILSSPRIALKYRLHASNASKNRERMFSNCVDVVRHHLKRVPKQSVPKVTRSAYRWLYSYLGNNTVKTLKHSLKTTRRIDIKNVKILFAFLRPALNDAYLLKRILSDFMPEKLARLLKRRLRWGRL